MLTCFSFNLFNKYDNGFTERIKSNTERLSPWKIPRRYCIGWLSKEVAPY